MKKPNRRINRVLAPMLSVVLVMQAAVPLTVLADKELSPSKPVTEVSEEASAQILHIKTREDWESFVNHCRLDAWSEGITVSLDEDINISGCKPVPTFGGTFIGNNHTLKGVNLKGEGDVQGVFRYIREGAVVKNLFVSGVVSPSGSPAKVGGLAGENSGLILNCRFLGVVSGKSSVGGLVGVNTVSGRIENCENVSGAITGEHYSGGIAGENYGSIINSINYAQVNIDAVEPVAQLDNVDWEKLNSTENVTTSTDVGGVAGYSQGLLQLCRNYGPVGYPHLGYNVGGVAGRQSGMMVDCENFGFIQGRKDVGGIVGQAEPYTELQYQESTLQKLSKELDNLSSLMEQTLNSTDNSRREISGHITNITGHTDSAKENVSDMLDHIENVGEDSVDTVNDLSSRVQDFLNDLGFASGSMENAADQFAIGLNQIENAISRAEQGNVPLDQARAEVEQALQQMNDTYKDIVSRIPSAPEPWDPPGNDEPSNNPENDESSKIPETPDNPETPETPDNPDTKPDTDSGKDKPDKPVLPDFPEWNDGEWEDIKEGMEDIMQYVTDGMIDASAGLQVALEHFQNASGNGDELQEIFSDALSMIGKASNDFSRGASRVSDSFDDLERALHNQAGLPKLELPKLPQEFHDTENDLRDTLTSLNDEMEAMNQAANRGGDVLSDNLKAVNNQFNAVTDVIRNAEEFKDEEDLIVDLSEAAAADATWGKLQNCKNTGRVEGDVNVGGVAGSMAIEYDFDPEDDVTKKGDSSMNFHYLTHAILLNCENHGEILSRKDYTGSVVGRMDLGIVLGAKGFGSVESSSGQYIGGIAGYSGSVIQDSWAKCSLAGVRKVGGIAGEGHDIRSCKSLVEIHDAESYLGAIAGDADGTLENNIFVSDTLGGVDSISYQGKAHPVEYQTLIAGEEVPQELKQLTLTFWNGDTLVDTLTVGYGEAVPEESIPSVPKKEGCYGSWSDFDKDRLLFNAQVEAVYQPWLTAVSSADGKILAEGRFRPGSVLNAEPIALDSPVEQDRHLGMYKLSLPEGEQGFSALRIALPKELKNGQLWLLNEDESWTQLNTTKEGSYLRAEVQGTEAVICLASNIADSTMLLILAGAGGAALILVIVFLGKKKKRKSQKKEKQPSEEKPLEKEKVTQ